MKAKTIILIFFIALFLLFLFQNTQVVTLRFLLWQVSMSQALFMPIVLLIGVVLGYVAGRVRR